MLKLNRIFFLITILFIVTTFSCLTTTETVQNQPSTETQVIEQNQDEIVQNTNLDSPNIESVEQEENQQQENIVQMEETEVIVEPLPEVDVAELHFITSGKTPDSVRNGKTFKTPFSATVKKLDDESPAVGIEVVVKYPVSKKSNEIQFAQSVLLTDENGIVTFHAETTSFACRSQVTFTIGKDEKAKSVSIPYVVSTNRMSNGTISILDYTKNGNPVLDNSQSASAILTAMIRRGYSSTGLADFVEEIQSGNQDKVYRAAKNLLGNYSNFLLYGTVRYNGEITKESSTYTIPLIAEITCLDMATGEELHHDIIQVEGKGSSEWAALNNARADLLAPQVAESVIYGM
ncbi:MAG: hypothetical protein J6B81_02020 [Spirochaetaceae bacterium]|nr:hypothetical protein [Spirochaetaceae bacterium]